MKQLKNVFANKCYIYIDGHDSTQNVKSLEIQIRRSPSLSELTPIILNTGLTHLGSEASIYHI